ncbi:MAG: electron transfer flavoprotein subunit alpha/FixB family protein [Clostridia bacterium]|jgi:electron transfer flavoprotein alpha subunit|nr:electron transfer flavoprotein subunit alpha/FixB family protein [Clostridia bacterium]
MDIGAWKGIWVIAEQIEGTINSVSFELLGKAKQLKEQLKSSEPVTAVLLGSDIQGLADELGQYGAEEVIVIEHEKLAIFENDTYAAVLNDLIQERKPEIVLMGATAIGQDLAPMLGGILKTGVAAHCVDVNINEEGKFVAVVPAFGGKVLGDIFCPDHRPQMATLKPGILGEPVLDKNAVFKVTAYNAEESLKKVTGRVKAVGIYKNEIQGIPLEKAEVVVVGGWGIGSKENWSYIEELATLLGGAVGCTRPAVDENWAEGEHQMIGTSGKSVRPKVYIGAAVSGSTHHLCGMKDSGLVISINTDENAPIFDSSDVCIVADAAKFLPKLIERIKQA